MSPQARIHSIPLLKELRASLLTFASVASVAVDEANSEIERIMLWLREDQSRYWKQQLQARTDEYGRAKRALKQREVLDRALSGSTSSCVDEKRAVKKAEKRLREAEHKVRMVRMWTRQLEKELLEYKGAIQGLVTATETQIPNACARLDRMRDSLEKYVAIAPPEMRWDMPDRNAGAVLRAPEAADSTSPVVRMREKMRAWQNAAPSAETRADAPLKSSPGQWLGRVPLSEALRTAVRENTHDPMDAEPTERVVVAHPPTDPEVVYLQRAAPSEGDSGWYVGVDEDADSGEMAAVRIRDLLAACPALSDLLKLPTGFAVLIAPTAGLEIVLDPDDRMIWWNLPRDETEAASASDESGGVSR
jgi:hypothetical protein